MCTKVCVSGNIYMYICACGALKNMCVSMYVCKSTCLSGKIYVDVYVFSLPCTLSTYQAVQMPSLSPSTEIKISPIDVH